MATRDTIVIGASAGRGVPFPRIDLVTCRNLLIYLKPEVQHVVLDLFAYSLQQSSGFLFLGKAETARPTKATFELVNKKWKIYRYVGGLRGFPCMRLQLRPVFPALRGVSHAVLPFSVPGRNAIWLHQNSTSATCDA